MSAVLWFERRAVSDSLVATYKEAIAHAASQGNNDHTLLLAKALDSLRPADSATIFNTAVLLAKDSPDEALSRMLALAPDGRLGFSSARLWLVRQARGQKTTATDNCQSDEIATALSSGIIAE